MIARVDRTAILRACAVVFVYFVLWLIFDRLSYHYAKYATPWYLATGLSFYLVYTFGLRYAPAVVAVEVIRGLFSSRHYLTFEWLFLLGLVTALIVASAVYTLRRIGVRLFAGFGDAITYLSIGCVLFPIVRSFVGVAVVDASGSLHWQNYWRDFFNFGIGDLVGMATLVPFLILFVTPLVAPKRAEPQDHPLSASPSEIISVVALLIVAVIVGYGFLRTQSDAAVYLMVFLPLTWLVVRGGLPWGVLGLVVSDIAIVVFQHLVNVSEGASAAYQSYIAASSFTVLTLGSAVNQRHREEREAIQRARCNPITGLPSRQAFEEWLAFELQPGRLAFLVAEFDAVRLADEWLDPRGVDALQASVAERLREHAAGVTMLAHATSNTLALVLQGADEGQAIERAEAIAAAFEQPVNVGETELYVSPVFGIAFGTDSVAAYKHATQALRIARKQGHRQIVAYRSDRDQGAVLSLVAQLHRAYLEKEFLLYYQPIFASSYNAETGETSVQGLMGAEALLRWNHPDHGIMEPSAFLELLDSMPLSEQVGEWVVDTACRTLAMLRPTFPDCSMWINLFARQAFAPNMADTVRRRIERHAVPANALVFELNEKMIAEDEAELEVLVKGLHRLGVRVAVDDFGTGASSYARLREASVDVLKIDKSFIPATAGASKTSDVLLGLLKFAQDLGVTAVAEGVETPQQCAWLAQNGCTIVQGFALGPPLPSYAFLELVNRALNTRIEP